MATLTSPSSEWKNLSRCESRVSYVLYEKYCSLVVIILIACVTVSCMMSGRPRKELGVGGPKTTYWKPTIQTVRSHAYGLFFAGLAEPMTISYESRESR